MRTTASLPLRGDDLDPVITACSYGYCVVYLNLFSSSRKVSSRIDLLLSRLSNTNSGSSGVSPRLIFPRQLVANSGSGGVGVFSPPLESSNSSNSGSYGVTQASPTPSLNSGSGGASVFNVCEDIYKKAGKVVFYTDRSLFFTTPHSSHTTFAFCIQQSTPTTF